MINSFFPSFGILFATFKSASMDLLILLIFHILILLSFSIAGTILFAGIERNMSNLFGMLV